MDWYKLCRHHFEGKFGYAVYDLQKQNQPIYCQQDLDYSD